MVTRKRASVRWARCSMPSARAGCGSMTAAVAGGTVRVPGWPSRTTQPGVQFTDLLARMGGHVSLDGDVLTVTGDGTVHGLDVDLSEAGELAPTCLLYTSDAADDLLCVDLGGRRIIKKKKK